MSNDYDNATDYINELKERNAKLVELLKWMDRKGGLGLDVHERLRAAITENET